MSDVSAHGINQKTFDHLARVVEAKGFKPAGYTETEFGYVLMGEARRPMWEADEKGLLIRTLKVFWVCGDFGRYVYCNPASSPQQRMQACVDDATLVCAGSPHQQPGVSIQ
jgi:hypothetical protein